jgi:GntR family transcriptional regulator/MocR family aminotransferase
LTLWRRLTREVLDGITPKDLAYGEPQGIAELRHAIAAYLVGRRGLRCSAEDIVVVAGTTQAVGLIAQLFVSGKRSQVVVEDPVTVDIRRILASRGATCVPVPVDDHGLQTELLPSELDPALVYVTPSHQYPLGGILPARRRLELVQYARDRASFVVEDDYDTEFRFTGSPVGSIQELAPDRVIYIGSFSKTIFPGLRVAFVVLPSEVIDRARETKWHADLHNPVIEQKVLTRFLQDGHFERHVQRSRRQLARKREVLCSLLEEGLGDSVQILGDAAGLHLAARFLDVRFTDAFMATAENEGIKLYRASDHAYNHSDWSDTLLFGFGMLGIPQIERGVGILRKLLNRSNEASASSR